MKNSLGLVDDGDATDFIEEIETAFGIKFQNGELEKCQTFGDLYDAACRHIQPVERGAFPCLSASAYRRLKKVIVALHPGAQICPDTRLADLVGDQRLDTSWLALERRSGLKLPTVAVSGWRILLAVAAIALFVGPLVIARVMHDEGSWLWLAFALSVACVAGCIWLPFEGSTDIKTVGELARAVGARNVAALSQPHGAVRAREVWSSLVQIARECAPDAKTIDRETILVG